nr:hypothetical protein B0A51_01566 [Rachicladosporium sp. CCFEE 5018]
MAFNSDDHVDHAGYAAQADNARQKFAARTQWMTDELLRDSRIENKKANTKFALGLENHGISAAWNAAVELWWSRYEATLTKSYVDDRRGDMSSLPTGDGITLVLSTFAAQLRSRDRNQSGDLEPVMLGTIQTGFLALMSKFNIKYPGWKLDSYERTKIKNMFARLVKEGIVRIERSQRLRSSLPLRSANIILRRYLVRALSDGVRSPDGLVNDMLIFTLLCTTGARAGDVASVKGEAAFGSHCIRIEDVELRVAGHELNPGWSDVRCQITVKWFKTNELQTRPPQVHRLSALSSEHAVLDPLCWLLVHFRQRLLLLFDSVQTILSRAAARGDRRIILAPSAAKQPLFLKLSPHDTFGSAVASRAEIKPAPSEFLGSRVTQIGFLAGALQSLASGHSLRRGTAEDLLALGDEWSTGATSSASTVLGHADKSQRKGLTSYYADSATTGLLNARSDKLLTDLHSNTLQYDNGVTKRTPIATQAPTWETDRERGWLHHGVITELKNRQPQAGQQTLKNQARAITIRVIREAHLAGLSPRVYVGQKIDLDALQHLSTDLDSGLAISPVVPDMSTEDTAGWDDEEPSALITEGDTTDFLASNNIGSGTALADLSPVPDISTLCEDMLNDPGTDISRAHLAVMESEGESLPTAESGTAAHAVLSMTAPELVQFFSAYNVIKKMHRQPASDLARYSQPGKDPPQFMVYHCPKGCGFSSEDWHIARVDHECKQPKIVRPYRSRQDRGLGPDLTRSMETNTVYGVSETLAGPQLAPLALPAKRTHLLISGSEPGPSLLPSDSLNDGATTKPPKKRIELPRMVRCPEPGCKTKPFLSQHQLRTHLRRRTHAYSNDESAAVARELWEKAESPGWLEAP